MKGKGKIIGEDRKLSAHICPQGRIAIVAYRDPGCVTLFFSEAEGAIKVLRDLANAIKKDAVPKKKKKKRMASVACIGGSGRSESFGNRTETEIRESLSDSPPGCGQRP